MNAQPAPVLAELDGVWKEYGGNWALQDVHMTVTEGRTHALIGPNGAGKSTLFGVISGEHRISRGSLQLFGLEQPGRPSRRVRRGLARGFQVARVFAGMTVAENILVAVAAGGRETTVMWRPRYHPRVRAQAEELIESLALGDLRGTMAGILAQGDRKRLEIAMALASKPRLLLLDEPTAGMSQEETDLTVRLVASLYPEHGTTVLISEHDMKVVFTLADEVTVLHQGEVLCFGAPLEVRNDPRVIAAYLGEEG
jgi:branched-chain amino acid transport system ATP-binding protein